MLKCFKSKTEDSNVKKNVSNSDNNLVNDKNISEGLKEEIKKNETHVEKNDKLSSFEKDFKNQYDKLIDTTFKSIPFLKGSKELTFNQSLKNNNGDCYVLDCNKTIRSILSDKLFNCIEVLTNEIFLLLIHNIEEKIKKIKISLFLIPEIEKELIGDSETHEIKKKELKNLIDTLIQIWAIPAINCLISEPRIKDIRSKLICEYETELMRLDCFYENDEIVSRGIVPFIANGTHAKYKFKIKNNKENFISKKYNNKIRNIKEVYNFENLKYSSESKNFNEVHEEIMSDFNEFIACMKNSVFYGSLIQLIFKFEIKSLKSLFIKKEAVWINYLFKYLYSNNSKVKILLPKVDNQTEQLEIFKGKLNEVTRDINL